VSLPLPPSSFFTLLAKTRAGLRGKSNQTTPITSPRNLPQGATDLLKAPSHETAGHRTHRGEHFQSQSKVVDEKQHIEREIEILQHRLELLANRALYASRIQQMSEAPRPSSLHDQSPKHLDSSSLGGLSAGAGGGIGGQQSSSKKLRLYHGSTVGISASNRNHLNDSSAQPFDRRLGSEAEGSDYDEPLPLSYRSARDDHHSPSPASTRTVVLTAGGGDGIAPMHRATAHTQQLQLPTLPLQYASPILVSPLQYPSFSSQPQKSYAEIEAFNRKSFESEPKYSSCSSTEITDGNGHVVVLSQRRSGRYEPNHSEIWKTPEEEKPNSDLERDEGGDEENLC
jgi:hypothetical protein